MNVLKTAACWLIAALWASFGIGWAVLFIVIELAIVLVVGDCVVTLALWLIRSVFKWL